MAYLCVLPSQIEIRGSTSLLDTPSRAHQLANHHSDSAAQLSHLGLRPFIFYPIALGKEERSRRRTRGFHLLARPLAKAGPFFNGACAVCSAFITAQLAASLATSSDSYWHLSAAC